jgi:outer membrane receptor protein involved in Fe transport
VVAALAVLSAFAASAHAGLLSPAPVPAKGTSMDWFIQSLGSPGPAGIEMGGGIFRPTFVQGMSAGANFHNGIWSASLFVSRATQMGFADDGAARLATSPVVNGSISRPLAPDLRLSLDVFNVFDRSPASADYFAASQLWQPTTLSDSYLFHPGEPRGFRVRLRKTF